MTLMVCIPHHNDIELEYSVWGHFVKLIEVSMRRITCSPGHICVQPENRRGTGVFLCPTES